MRCPNCGTENEDGVRFCKGCGSEMRTPAGNRGASPNYSTQAPLPKVDSGEDYTPISMWGYFGYQLLFGIPCVGFILILIFSFGGTKNVNVKNFARSYFCYMIVLIALVFLLSLFGGGLTSILSRRYYY